ncbi:MAG: relaxase/mobilization nuclease domain-containing protein [Clostridiales bacterium]|nr:relaxase/mobilization nuclease domain-containing protein [Clostridiales bacterium]
MAVTKLWSVTQRLGQVIDYATNPEKTNANIKRQYTETQYQALADVLSYAKDEEKTEKEFYVDGINCSPFIAREQFITVKEHFQKEDGIQAYHGYISFKETDISPEMAQHIGMEFANEVWGKRFQVVVTTHLNTKHLHCHFVINSISFVDGKHLWGDEKAWFKFRKTADRICEKYGLYYNPTPNRSKQSEYLTMKEKAGIPTRYSVAKEAIDYAIDHSKTLSEFQYALKEMGYSYNLSPQRKYWTVTPKGYNKPIRLKNLGEDYTNERIIKRIKDNRERWDSLEPFQKQEYKPRQYSMQTRGQKLQKKGGLYGLYLYYCYRLGYLSKYKKQNNARLHYLLKEDLMKLDKITDEVRLLGRENISTDEQLFSYKASAMEQMKTLAADRTLLRKRTRTNITDEELSKAKDEIASINKKLKTLRKEVKLCDSIAERSKVMTKNIEQIHAEEEKLQRKEKSRNEQRW